MDSLLSNAQRCVRKADSLVKYGLFDEALGQLDKSIVFLHELKAVTSCYDSIQMLNVQIDSIDRKMRSVAIKRSESIKKKTQIENLINNKRRESTHRVEHKQPTNQSVLVEHTNLRYKNASKLNKDDKSIIEELSTTNGEYKKVNEFLINEIEQLKKENDFLKVELLKIHMNDSLNDLSSSDNANSSSISNSSSSILTTNSNLNGSSSSSNDVSNESLDTYKYLARNPSGLTMTSQRNEKSQHRTNLNDNTNRIDLSKYINNEDDEDSDAEIEDNIFNELNNQNLLHDTYHTSFNLPPNEFVID